MTNTSRWRGSRLPATSPLENCEPIRRLTAAREFGATHRGSRVAAGTAWGDAGAFLSEQFATVTQSAVLERAIELLMATAETGTLADRKSATDQVARVLHGRGLL